MWPARVSLGLCTSVWRRKYSVVILRMLYIYQIRSAAKCVGCLQRRLFVCLFVNTITSERVNIGWWILGIGCIVQKSRPSSNLGVIAPSVRTPNIWRWITTLGKSAQVVYSLSFFLSFFLYFFLSFFLSFFLLIPLSNQTLRSRQRTNSNFHTVQVAVDCVFRLFSY